MKYLTLKVLRIHTGDPAIDEAEIGPEIDYRDRLLVAISINGQQEGGMDALEMHRRLRLLDVIEPAKKGDTISLEDEDHKKLVALVDRPIWTQFSRDLLRFIDDVKNAQELPEVSSNGKTEKPVLEAVK